MRNWLKSLPTNKNKFSISLSELKELPEVLPEVTKELKRRAKRKRA